MLPVVIARSTCDEAIQLSVSRQSWIASLALAMTLRDRCSLSLTVPCKDSLHVGIRSARLTIFWHCGFRHFSFRTGSKRAAGNKPSMVLVEDGASQGSGNADSQRKVWSSGGSGPRRASPGDSGCVPAHPADWRASASYRPLRAVWAVCAWALRGCARSPDPFSAQRPAHHLKELSK
jgi:hypothetical protein